MRGLPAYGGARGGDGFWLISGPGTGGVQALNASGRAGQGATMEFYRERGCESGIPARGALAALTVPGAVDRWRAAHERLGRLAWADLFAAAIEYARDGMPVRRSLADWLAQDLPILRQFPRTARVFLPGGEPHGRDRASSSRSRPFAAARFF